MSSTKFWKIVTDALAGRVTSTENAITTLNSSNLLHSGDNISLLANNANYQTLTQVDTKINALINSAPGTLDTLGEIASALAAEDSAIAALTAVNNTQNTQIATLTTQGTANANAIAALALENSTVTGRVTLGVNFNLVDYPQSRLHIVATANIIGALPAVTSDRVFVIKNAPSSTGTITINSVAIAPGEIYEVSSDGTAWVEW
jgi:hypothetical protein